MLHFIDIDNYALALSPTESDYGIPDSNTFAWKVWYP